MSFVVAAIVTTGIVAGTSVVMSYESSRRAGSMAADQAAAEAAYKEQQAQQAKERAEQEAKLERERIAYEAKLAAENAAYEISIAEENAEVTIGQQKKQYDLLHSAQIAGMAAAGLLPMGSTLAVMKRSTTTYEEDVGEVRRALSIFSTTRTREAEEVAKGGEFGLSQFLARNTRETRFEATNRLAEASMARRKGSAAVAQSKYAQYGALLSLAGVATKTYGLAKLPGDTAWGVLAAGG